MTLMQIRERAEERYDEAITLYNGARHHAVQMAIPFLVATVHEHFPKMVHFDTVGDYEGGDDWAALRVRLHAITIEVPGERGGTTHAKLDEPGEWEHLEESLNDVLLTLGDLTEDYARFVRWHANGNVEWLSFEKAVSS